MALNAVIVRKNAAQSLRINQSATLPINVQQTSTGPLSVAIAVHQDQNVKVNSNAGFIQSTTPITLKNQISEIRSIEDIYDVDSVDVTTGATLVYNQITDKYEVRKLDSTDITGTLNIDGGDF